MTLVANAPNRKSHALSLTLSESIAHSAARWKGGTENEHARACVAGPSPLPSGVKSSDVCVLLNNARISTRACEIREGEDFARRPFINGSRAVLNDALGTT